MPTKEDLCECGCTYNWHFEYDNLPSGRTGCGYLRCPCKKFKRMPLSAVIARTRREIRKIRDFTDSLNLTNEELAIFRHKMAGSISGLLRTLGYKRITIK